VALAGLQIACGEAGPVDGPPNRQEAYCIAGFPENEMFAAAAVGGIPALKQPNLADAQAGFMLDTDRVVGVEINGEARAYPFGILWWHEIVNDSLGGRDVLVTYCPLTASGIVFDPTVAQERRDFIVSGLLYYSNLVMTDIQTQTLWNQMLLGSQCGVDRGEELRRFPVLETTWEDWKNRHPNTTVVSTDTGFNDRPYFQYPYGNYADPDNESVSYVAEGVVWRNWLKTKELVLGVFDGTEAIAYSLEKLADRGVSHVENDEIGSTPFVVVYRSPSNAAQAFDRRLNGDTLTFALTSPDPFIMTDATTGSEWNAQGAAISGPLAGQRLTPVVDSYMAFWFAWSLYYPTSWVFT
jgi:hypothetical protein